MCARYGDGRILCWGLRTRLEAPTDAFVQLVTDSSAFCGLRDDGRLLCWPGVDPAPDERFTTVSGGLGALCGVRTDGTLWCSSFDASLRAVPAGHFHQVSVGGTLACATRAEDDSAVCWGSGNVAPAPAGAFARLSVGNVACGLRPNGSIECWGPPGNAQLNAPHGTYSDLRLWPDPYGAACVIDANTHVPWCWAFPQGLGYTQAPHRFMAQGDRPTCGLLETGELSCPASRAVADRPRARAVRVATYGYVNADGSSGGGGCHVREDGSVASWGGAYAFPAAHYVQATAGDGFQCALDDAMGVHCVGRNDAGQTRAPFGQFRSIDTGSNFSCGLGSDRSITCWGYGTSGGNRAPAGSFDGVSVGYQHACALVPDGSIRCWGSIVDTHQPPAGQRFVRVSAGRGFTCGLTDTGRPDCWASNLPAALNPPAGLQLREIAAGYLHVCAITTAGALTCWGSQDLANQARLAAPSGSFVALDASPAHTCAVRDDGVVICWGSAGGAYYPWR
jgi:hypothetical protein